MKKIVLIFLSIFLLQTFSVAAEDNIPESMYKFPTKKNLDAPVFYTAAQQ